MGTKGIKMDLTTALNVSESVITKVKTDNLNWIRDVVIAGSIRRNKKDDIGDIDLLILTESGTIDSEFNNYLKDKLSMTIISSGNRVIHALTPQGYQIDFYSTSFDEYPCMLNYLTGSQTHNIRMRGKAKKLGFKLNQYHLFDKSGEIIHLSDEVELYDALGTEYVEPEDR